MDERLVRWLGRGSARFTEGGAQVVHAGIDVARVLQEAATKLGAPRLRELTGLPPRTARALAAGRRPRGATLRRALEVLRTVAGDDPVAFLLDQAEGSRRCALPGCDGIARPRSRTCSERHRKALSRVAPPPRGDE